jgi:hypothetical protein
MIPWQWSIKPESAEPSRTSGSTEWKIGSLVFINSATLLAGFLGLKPRKWLYLRSLRSQSWFMTGIMITALHICANWINAIMIQSIPGYEQVPITQLVLLWCSMPRSTWITALLVGVRSSKATSSTTIASPIFAETILQALLAYHIMTAVMYGQEHSFYSQGMARLETAPSARFMYAGALMWVVVALVILVSLVQATRRPNVSSTKDVEVDTTSKRPTTHERAPNTAKQLVISFNKRWGRLEEALARRWADTTWDGRDVPTTIQTYTVYGTLPVTKPNTQIVKKTTVRLSMIAITGLSLLWTAQWLFWAGFIGFSMEEYVLERAHFCTISLTRARYCLPKLGSMTTIWIASSVVAAAIA